MTMHERIMSGKLFTDMCEGMPAERLKAKKLMKRFNDSEPDDIEGRVKLMAEIFGKPCDSWIEPPFYFCYGTHISLGKGCYINVNCNFIDDGKITIGDAVMFGPAVTIATVGHPIRPDMRGYMYCDHVTIGNYVKIGSKSGIDKNIPDGEIRFGYPALPGMNYHRSFAVFKNLPELQSRVRTLEKSIKEITEEK